MRRTHISKRWNLLDSNPETEAILQSELNLHPYAARILVQRGITSPEEADRFLNPSMSHFHDPFLLPDIEAGCERLKTALNNHEKILIHGDYDCDGVTSAALWTRCLRTLGADVDVFVPHRKRDGYDIRMPFIEEAHERGVKLIITTDCGIQRSDEVERAREHGIDMIITDHHEPSATNSLPKAVAVINPHRRDSKYPYQHLAGVGVAFKTCEALLLFLGQKIDGYRRGYLDLVALGTVADMMPLTGENRTIVKFGLERLRETKKPGLRAMIHHAGFDNKPIDSRSIGYHFGPRLNSAGRIDESRIALDILLTKDEAEGDRLARRLEELNIARREETDRYIEEALAQVAQMDIADVRCLVVTGSNWSAGIVGLVAGKIRERYNRPTIAISIDEQTGACRGSARSIPGFDIHEALGSCTEFLGEFGGHQMAAGLSMEHKNITDFSAQLNRLASLKLSDENFAPTLEVSIEANPAEVTTRLVEQIAQMEPFGNGNPSPLFISSSARMDDVMTMTEKKHLKLRIESLGSNRYNQTDAIWWNKGDMAEGLKPGGTLDICYSPQLNYWKDNVNVQFMLEDVRAPEW